MPRNTALKVGRSFNLQDIISGAVPKKVQPKLFNAHRRVTSGRFQGIAPRALVNDQTGLWKKTVSEDVVEFVEKANMTPERRRVCLRNPPRYFSRPGNVPPELRKQIYFPDFHINLMRTPHLPPKYAAFDVPLWFNKLDMKGYLKSVYGVEVLHVRSTVTQAKVQRKPAISPYSQGRLYRPQSTKKMTVELVDPFIWPEPEEDLEPWEPGPFFDSQKYAMERNKAQAESATYKPNVKERKLIKAQAQKLLNGETVWKPTWQSIPADAKVLGPSNLR